MAKVRALRSGPQHPGPTGMRRNSGADRGSKDLVENFEQV